MICFPFERHKNGNKIILTLLSLLTNIRLALTLEDGGEVPQGKVTKPKVKISISTEVRT